MMFSKSSKRNGYPRWIMSSLLGLTPAIAAADSGSGTAEVQNSAQGEANCKTYSAGKNE